MTDERKLSTSDIAAATDRPATTAVVVKDGAAHEPGPRVADHTPAPLFVEGDALGYHTRWNAIQTGFVDEPRKAVEEADSLVAEVMKRLAEVFSEQRQRLEADWERNEQVST